MEEMLVLSRYRPVATRWLWPGRIPYGGVTILEGDPASNKSTIACALAAAVSTGRPLYPVSDASQPADVLLLAAEDSLATTHAMLSAAGADLNRIRVPQAAASEGISLRLPCDARRLEELVAGKGIGLVVLDPVTAFLEGSPHSDVAIRRALQPLVSLAQRSGTAVVLVRHLTKTAAPKALYRGAGSIGMIALARSCLLVAVHPVDPTCRIIAQTKSSLGPTAKSLAFRPVARDGAVAVEWCGESTLVADDLLDTGHIRRRPELEEAVRVLYQILCEGPLAVGDVQGLAAEAGVSKRTLQRAKEVLGVRSDHMGFGPDSFWYWELPAAGEVVESLKQQNLNKLMDWLCNSRDCLTNEPTEGGQQSTSFRG